MDIIYKDSIKYPIKNTCIYFFFLLITISNPNNYIMVLAGNEARLEIIITLYSGHMYMTSRIIYYSVVLEF